MNKTSAVATIIQAVSPESRTEAASSTASTVGSAPDAASCAIREFTGNTVAANRKSALKSAHHKFLFIMLIWFRGSTSDRKQFRLSDNDSRPFPLATHLPNVELARVVPIATHLIPIGYDFLFFGPVLGQAIFGVVPFFASCKKIDILPVLKPTKHLAKRGAPKGRQMIARGVSPGLDDQ